MKKDGRSLQEMTSAATFWEPAMWEALNWKENSSAKSAKRAKPCERCITNGSLLCHAAITCTMASLSHLKLTHCDFHALPHSPASSTMGRSSLAVMFA